MFSFILFATLLLSGSITEVIKELESNIDGREPIRITVRRSDVWLDAVQEAKTKGINGLSPLKVLISISCTI